LVREPTRRSEGRPPLLLLLHGVGSHEADLFMLAPHLDERFLIVSARAPHTLAPGMYAWFEVQLDPVTPVINPEQAEASRQILVQFIDEVVGAYNADPGGVFLMGFSQGAIMSLSLLLTQPEKVSGVVAMSGRVLPEVLPKMAPPEAMTGIPVLVVHGVADPILPVHHGRGIRDLLAKMPVDLTYKEYSMAHQVTQESLSDVAAWLRVQLDRGGKGEEAG
ncbi:MAG: alpha/beta hydrolase, partial [bacterium]